MILYLQLVTTIVRVNLINIKPDIKRAFQVGSYIASRNDYIIGKYYKCKNSNFLLIY